jgi:hypothetical protein
LAFLTFVVLDSFAEEFDVEIKTRLETEIGHGRSKLTDLDEQLGERQHKEGQNREARPRAKVLLNLQH